MRLRILDRGHDLPTRLTFAVVRRMARAEVPEVIEVAAYRTDTSVRRSLLLVRHFAVRASGLWVGSSGDQVGAACRPKHRG